MAAAFFITCSSDSPDGFVSRSINAFFSASSLARLRISSEHFSASANAIFSISALALGTSVDRLSVAVIVLSPPGSRQKNCAPHCCGAILQQAASSRAPLHRHSMDTRVNDRKWLVRHCPEGDVEYRYREARYTLV